MAHHANRPHIDFSEFHKNGLKWPFFMELPTMGWANKPLARLIQQILKKKGEKPHGD